MKLPTALHRHPAKPRSPRNGDRAGRQVERLEDRLLLTAVTLSGPSTNGGDGTWNLETRDGESVYVAPAYLYYNINPFAAFPGYQRGNALHVEVEYFDEGTGNVVVQYDSLRENFDPTDFHTRSTRIDTQEFVVSYHYLDSTEFANGANGHDFRVATRGVPIKSVSISNEPFPGSGLEWAWNPPWEAPYEGPSRSVDASTLAGKVLTGYQGWFNTPNDAADEGYVHWGQPGDWSVEQWPDPNDYDASELFPVPGVTTARGEQAYLFSSANDSVVDRHFQWMREHDIDGVFLQRFAESFMRKAPDGTYSGKPQWPVVNVRDAAHRSGRTWAIEYDIQKRDTDEARLRTIQEVKDDWEFLTDPDGLDLLNDSQYQREGGAPVVAIFGLYVGPNNAYSDAQQQDLIDYFQSRGVYVIGAGRHSESPSQLANAARHDAYIPWQGYWKGGDSFAPNEAILDGVTTHIPHVFPGFSWTHLQDSASATSRDREDGEFYWRMLDDAANETDAPWWFIGMFDEYDEGTNLIPATDDPPVPDTDAQGNPLTYQVSDPRPNDWWMALTGAAKQALQDKATITSAIPSESSLENRSNTGGEVRWEAGVVDRLASVPTPDSLVELVDVPVQGQTSTALRSNDPYLYFSVADEFLADVPDGRDVTIEVEYLDLLVGDFRLEYDGVGAPYTESSPASLTGSGGWRTHRFEVEDARFDNRQNGGADFRLTTPGGNLFVRSVSVIKENALTIEADLGPIDTDDGLRHVEQSGDGQSVTVTEQGRRARVLTGDPTSRYLYLDVDSQFAQDVHAGLNAIVEVVYRDVGVGQLNIQYDSTGAAYMNASAVGLSDSGEWRTARFYLDDAFFGGRQNGGSDLRITGDGIPIDRVRVLRSFGDLSDPTLAANPPQVDPHSNAVLVSWTLSDDWRGGQADRWTAQEDNRVLVETSGDGGLTWDANTVVWENADTTPSSSYDPATGVHNWSESVAIATSELPAGSYRLRLTPIDGRDNEGVALVTEEFVVEASPSRFGDYNADGNVNAADYTAWRDSVGTLVAAYTLADGDGSGIIDEGDFAVWRANYGTTPPVPSASASPIVALAVAGDPHDPHQALATPATIESDQAEPDASAADSVLADWPLTDTRATSASTTPQPRRHNPSGHLEEAARALLLARFGSNQAAEREELEAREQENPSDRESPSPSQEPVFGGLTALE